MPKTNHRSTELHTLLTQLNLTAMADVFADVALRAAKEGLSHEASLYELARLEMEQRMQRRTARLVRASGLPVEKTFRTLSLSRLSPALQLQLERLKSASFLETATNIIAIGIGSHGSLLHVFFDGHLQQSFDLVLLEDGLGGLPQRRSIARALFALLVLRQTFQFSLSFGQTGRQRLGGSRSQLVRSHKHLPFSPTDRFSCHFVREGDLSVEPLSNLFRLARFPLTKDRCQGLLACPYGLQGRVQDLLGHLLGRQRTQRGVLLCLQRGSCVQCGHLAISHVEQPVGVQASTHLRNGRQIEPIIGSLPGDDLRGDWQTQRIQSREHHLELRQVGTMVFAVAQLEQPSFRHRPIPTDRGTIDPHPFGRQVVDPDELSVQRRLTLLPLLLIRERIEHQRQAVIANAALTDLLSSADGQGLDPLGCPALHLIHPMIPFRQDVRQPDRCRPALAHTLPVAMRLEVLIQQPWYPHLVTVGQQEWQIVHSFSRHLHWFCHADSLLHFPNLVSIWPNHELTNSVPQSDDILICEILRFSEPFSDLVTLRILGFTANPEELALGVAGKTFEVPLDGLRELSQKLRGSGQRYEGRSD